MLTNFPIWSQIKLCYTIHILSIQIDTKSIEIVVYVSLTKSNCPSLLSFNTIANLKIRPTLVCTETCLVRPNLTYPSTITMRISMSFTNRPCMCPSHKRNIPVHWIDLLFRMLVVNSTTITFYSKPKLIWKILFVSLLFLIFFKKWFCTLILPQTTHWDKTHFFV